MGVIAVLLAASASAANVTFVAPLEGAQVIGPSLIEVTTDAANVSRVEFYVDGSLVGVARTAPYRIAFDFGEKMTSRDVAARVLFDNYRQSANARVVTAALTAGESINVDLVELPLRVRSDRTLRATDISVRENDTLQSIRDIKPVRGAAHFAFIVDRSSSMSEGKLEAAMKAVREARSHLRKDDTYSLTLFNHNVSSRSIDNVTASGGTSLRDAVVAALSDNKRNYAIVITDGGDRNSILSDEEALRRISGTRTIVSAVVLGRAGSFLQKATTNTGGALINGSRQSVAADVVRIIADINSRYTVVYQSHGNAAGWRRITVTSRKSDVAVLASRKGYFAE